MSPDHREGFRLTKILEALDTLSGIMTSPSATFPRIRDNMPLTLALFTAICVALISGLIVVPDPPRLIEVIFSIPQGTLSLSAMLPIWVAFFLAILAVQAAFTHVAAMILKAKGTYAGMICGICFAYTPGLIIAPLAALRAILRSEVGNTLYQTGFALLGIWIFLLGIAAVKYNYRMNPAKAAAICTIAFIVLVILPALLAVVVMTNLMS